MISRLLEGWGIFSYQINLLSKLLFKDITAINETGEKKKKSDMIDSNNYMINLAAEKPL